MAGDPDIIVLNKENPAPEPLILADLNDLLDQIFPHLVVGMGLAGKDDMNRAGRMIEDPVQTVQVGQEHIRALVRSEAPGEADHQGCRIDLRKKLLPPGL